MAQRNYIKEMNDFYDLLELNPVSASAIVLWSALMHINNKYRWKLGFTVAISTLEVKTSLKRRTIERARNELKQRGLIKWRSRRGNQSAMYEMIPVAKVLEEEYEDEMFDKDQDEFDEDFEGEFDENNPNDAQDVVQSDVQKNDEKEGFNTDFGINDAQSVVQCDVQGVAQPVAQCVAIIKHKQKHKLKTKDNNNNIAESEMPESKIKPKPKPKPKSRSESKTIDKQAVFDHFIKKNIVKHRQLTKKMNNAINKFCKDNPHLTQEDLIQGLDHYAQMLKSDYEFCNYVWGIEELFSRSEGLAKFLDDGTKWLNYLKWQNEKSKPENGDVSVPKKTALHNFEGCYDNMSNDELEEVFRDN
jgi:hypothetical protein